MSLLRAFCCKNYEPAIRTTGQCAIKTMKWLAISGALWTAQIVLESHVKPKLNQNLATQSITTGVSIAKWGSSLIGTGFAGITLFGISNLISNMRSEKQVKSRS